MNELPLDLFVSWSEFLPSLPAPPPTNIPNQKIGDVQDWPLKINQPLKGFSYSNLALDMS